MPERKIRGFLLLPLLATIGNTPNMWPAYKFLPDGRFTNKLDHNNWYKLECKEGKLAFDEIKRRPSLSSKPV